MPKPAFTTVGKTSIAAERLASSRAEPTKRKNWSRVAATPALISPADAALAGPPLADSISSSRTRTVKRPIRARSMLPSRKRTHLESDSQTSTTLADFEVRDSQISFSVTHGWSALGGADH